MEKKKEMALLTWGAGDESLITWRDVRGACTCSCFWFPFRQTDYPVKSPLNGQLRLK